MAPETHHYASNSKPATVLEEVLATNGTLTNANFGNADNANLMIAATSFTMKEHKHQIHVTLFKYHTTLHLTNKRNNQTPTTHHLHHNRNTKDLEPKVTTDAAKKDAAEKHAATKSKKKSTMETVSKEDHPQ